MRATVLLLVLAATLGVASAAEACSCVFEPPARQLKRADAAVVARQVAVRPTLGEPTADFVYRVGRVVKRAPGLQRGRRISVRSLSGSSVCGLDPDIGQLAGMFLYRKAGRWRTSACGQLSPRKMRRLGGGRAAASPFGCGG